SAENTGAHASQPARRHAAPARPSTPLDEMRAVSDELGRHHRVNPSLSPAQPGRPETQRPHELALPDIVKIARESAGALIALGAFVEQLNGLGQRSPERNIRSAAVMLPLALFDVHNRRVAMRDSGRVRVSEGEEMLLKVYAAANDGNLPIPEWFWA